MSIKTDPFWKEQGLPEDCPECGEEDDLYATTEETHVPNGINVDVKAATVGCHSCHAEWGWTSDAGE